MTNKISSTENRRTARRFFEEMGSDWEATLNDIFDDTIIWQIPAGAAGDFPGTHTGKQTIIDMMCGAVSGAFKPGTQKSEILLDVAENDLVIFEILMTAETLDDKHYENNYVFIFRFNDAGKVIELREHVDTHIARSVF